MILDVLSLKSSDVFSQRSETSWKLNDFHLKMDWIQKLQLVAPLPQFSPWLLWRLVLTPENVPFLGVLTATHDSFYFCGSRNKRDNFPPQQISSHNVNLMKEIEYFLPQWRNDSVSFEDRITDHYLFVCPVILFLKEPDFFYTSSVFVYEILLNCLHALWFLSTIMHNRNTKVTTTLQVGSSTHSFKKLELYLSNVVMQ